MTTSMLLKPVVPADTRIGRGLWPGYANAVITVVIVLLLAACRSATTTQSPQAFDVKASLASLQAAGWTAKEAPGMPDTVSKFKQVGYLETTAPDGQQIDMQFMEDTPKAAAELAAVAAKSPSFQGATIGNVMVVSHSSMGDKPVPAADLDALRKLLK